MAETKTKTDEKPKAEKTDKTEDRITKLEGEIKRIEALMRANGWSI